MFRKSLALAAAFLGVVCFLPERSARGEDQYYTMIFGSQTHPKRLRYTHTWAIYVRAVDTGDPAGRQLYQHTISWFPSTLKIRTWSPHPEQGVNLDFHRTLDVVYKNGESVTMWGPFQIQPILYERSLSVKAMLESGAVQYRAISTPQNLLVSDCIHAVAAVDPVFGRDHYPLIRVGKPASRHLARQVMTRSAFDQYQIDASWLIPRLGLDRYPIEVIAPRQIPKRDCFLCVCPD